MFIQKNPQLCLDCWRGGLGIREGFFLEAASGIKDSKISTDCVNFCETEHRHFGLNLANNALEPTGSNTVTVCDRTLFLWMSLD